MLFSNDQGPSPSTDPVGATCCGDALSYGSRFGGKTATGIEVPSEIVAQLDAGKRPAVEVTIGPHTYRATVGVMGGRSWLPLSAENRRAAGVAAGDDVEVEVVLDTEPRIVDVSADLASALDATPGMRRDFDALSHTRRKEWVRAIEEAKKPETRERRVAKVIESLRQG